MRMKRRGKERRGEERRGKLRGENAEERRGVGILTAENATEDLTFGWLPRRLTSTSSSLCKQDQSPLPYRVLTVNGILKCGYDKLLYDAVPLVVVFAFLCG